MALHIKNDQGFIEVTGLLDGHNMNVLRTYLETEFRWHDFLTLSLEKLHGIENSCAIQLEGIYRKAAGNNQVLSVIGRYHNPVSSVMQQTKTDYILSHDRI